VGEFIAASIFEISLNISASSKGNDGYFKNGNLGGSTVNVKWYTKHEGLLDLNTLSPSDYYLVLTGPKAPAASSRGTIRPWTIESVFLFNSAELTNKLKLRGVKVGVATSVTQQLWSEAEIYPISRNREIVLNEDQRKQLALFSQRSIGEI